MAFLHESCDRVGRAVTSADERTRTSRNYGRHSLNMAYNTIHPPFTLKLREMPRNELYRYFQWFIDVLPERVVELAQAVKQTPGFETWQPDCTPASLDTLGEWFPRQVEMRNRTQEELQAIKDRLAFPVEISGEELTNRTFSLAMDVGMYFSQVLLKNYQTLRWEQPTNDKKFADYGQAVLMGFSNAPLNPVRIILVLARSIANKKQTGKRLRELYNIWAKLVQPVS